MKIEKTLRKQENSNSNWLGNLRTKLKPEKTIVHFVNNSGVLKIGLNQIQAHSNPATHPKIEYQQHNGLIYANIVRVR
jgi:hypothetical protein